MHVSKRRGGLLLVTAMLAFCVLLQSAAVGDVIHRKSGPPLEGKIISETATKVVLKTAFGTAEILKSDIVRIERGKTKKEQYEERLKSLKFDDKDGFKKLALWCEDQGLKKEAEHCYERILRIDPGDSFANRALGRVEYKGKWYTPDEFKKLLKAEAGEPEKEPAPPPPEKPQPSGGSGKPEGDEPGGRPNAPSPEAGRGGADIGAVFQKALGEKPVVVQSDHFRIITLFEEQEAKELLELAEKVHADFVELLGDPEGSRYWTLSADEFIVSSKGQYIELIDKVIINYNNNKGTLDFWKQGSGGLINPFPPVAACIRHNQPVRNRVLHHCGHFLLSNYVGPRKPIPAWLSEGFAMYMEYKYEKTCRVHCVTPKQYGGDTKLAKKASDSSTWPELVKTSVIDGTHTPFEKLKHIMINELDFEHLSKSWSLVTFLVDEHEDKFVTWIKNMRRMQWEEAMFKAYHWTNVELDKEWGLWVKAIY